MDRGDIETMTTYVKCISVLARGAIESQPKRPEQLHMTIENNSFFRE